MSQNTDCIFCKIVTGDIPSFELFEDDASLAFMDINPASEGHCLVIAKQHVANVFEIDEAALLAVAGSARRIAVAVQAALRPEGLNLLQANGPGAAQSVQHFHIHVLPRSIGDDLPLNWPDQPGDMGAISALADRIRAQL